MIIYLYIKQCSHCNLRYFGKTTKTDVYEYLGSGLRWKRHLKYHKVKPKTNQIWSFDSVKEANEFALDFSYKHNIVESDEWANLQIENAIDGAVPGIALSENHRNRVSEGLKGHRHSEESKKKMSLSRKGKSNGRLGIPHSEETKKKMSDSRMGNSGYWLGKNRSEETKVKIGNANKGNIGYWLGKNKSEETKLKISNTLKNTLHFKKLNYT